LGLPGQGRTALLAVAHRMRPALARFLSDLFFEGAYRWAGPDEDGGPPVEFVAVPALAGGAEPRRHSESGSHWRNGGTATAAPRLRAPRGGAGLEVDLAEAVRLEQLPAEVRGALPRKGMVNYLEAQAVVRRLEALVGDPAFAAEAEGWQRRPGNQGP